MAGLCNLTITGRAIDTPHDTPTDTVFTLTRAQGIGQAGQTIEIHTIRRLARNVRASIHPGDMLLVTGYLHTPGPGRTPVIHASHIGHDLRFGTSAYANDRPDHD